MRHWYIKSLVSPQAAKYRRHRLESPLNGDPSESPDLHLRGWIEPSADTPVRLAVRSPHGPQMFEMNERRPDVVRVLGLEASLAQGAGFRIAWSDTRVPWLELGIEQGSEIQWLWKIYTAQLASVEEGLADWLFLGNDSNRSIDQYTGRMLMSPDTLLTWEQHCDGMQSIAKTLQCRWALLVAPAKELVFPEFYRHTAGACTPVEQLQQATVRHNCLVWPLQRLRACRELAYWKGDTHWTDFGASQATAAALEHLGIDTGKLLAGAVFRPVQRAGDLGGKCQPKRLFALMDLVNPASRDALVFSNRIHNHSRLDVYEPAHPHTDQSCLLFGDSFAVNMLPWIVPFFRRTVYVHSAAAVDESLLRIERPDIVLLQTNSRFLVQAPQPDFSLAERMKAKFDAMTPTEQTEVEASLVTAKALRESKLSRIVAAWLRGEPAPIDV
jgi:hypothetical protein